MDEALGLIGYLKVVSELQARLRALPQYLGSSVTESWLRRYQVSLSPCIIVNYLNFRRCSPGGRIL